MIKRNNKHVYFVATIAAFGGLLFGYDTGVISGALLLIKTQFAEPGAHQMLPELQEWVVSVVLIGAMIGAIISGKLADKFGRKIIIIVTSIIFIIGSTISGLAPDVTFIIIGRIIIGLAIGVASFTVPLYISEISPKKIRGALVSLNQLAITIGIFASYLVDLGFAETHEGWRWMFIMGVLPAIVLGLGMLFLPDTPRWLMSHKKDEAARLALEKTTDPDDIQNEIDSIKQILLTESKNKSSISELLQPWLRPALIIGIGIMLFQQFTGINTVIYYAPTIFQIAGFHGDFAPIMATTMVGIVNILFTIVAIWLLDRWGRKPLLYLGLSGMVVALTILGIAFNQAEALGSSLKWISVGSVAIYIAFFAISLGPIAWLIISEIYPLRIRGIAMSIATFSNWLFNFIVAKTFLTLTRALTIPGTEITMADGVQSSNPAGAFWLFAIIGIGGLIFTYYYMPETKGQTLEDIQEHWVKGKQPRMLK
ncbi:MAG TPA: sugar porter family MFS transporter [Bacteroidales bacterium]|jgi:sugar porter (SP) family MFS transporter|nr:sugar porter family MFS transporter [Bacteroidales bacterium]|tara:strand:+ start:139 stop:1581 length:1443 start_codon:yes stop_codon:yes gene_type:complete